MIFPKAILPEIPIHEKQNAAGTENASGFFNAQFSKTMGRDVVEESEANNDVKRVIGEWEGWQLTDKKSD